MTFRLPNYILCCHAALILVHYYTIFKRISNIVCFIINSRFALHAAMHDSLCVLGFRMLLYGATTTTCVLSYSNIRNNVYSIQREQSLTGFDIKSVSERRVRHIQPLRRRQQHHRNRPLSSTAQQ